MEVYNITQSKKTPMEITSSGVSAETNTSTSGTIMIVLNGKKTELKPKPGSSDFYFFDALSSLDIDTKNPTGQIVLKKNGQSASYLEPIVHGDEVEVYWDN